MNAYTPLIGVAELAERITDAGDALLVVDCRFDLADPNRGRHDYLAGHVPGAVYASLDEDLSDMRRLGQGLGRHPLPDPETFAATLGRWGWQPGTTLAAYDAGSGAMAAARLWWLMHWMGVPARVLDGGLAAWCGAGQALEQGGVERPHTRVQVRFDPDKVLATAPLRERLAAGDVLLIDARAAPRYRGESEPIDPRAGHVPGARNRPFADNLEADGRFHPAAALRRGFGQLLEGRDPGQVAHMCGSGVTACHNLLAMEQAGLHGSRLYAPSWSGWVSDPDNPVAEGGK